MSMSCHSNAPVVIVGEQCSLGPKIVVEMWDEPVVRVTERFGVANTIHHNDEYVFGLVRAGCGRGFGYWRWRAILDLGYASKQDEKCGSK